MSEDRKKIVTALQQKNILTESLALDAVRVVQGKLAPIPFIEKVTRESTNEDCLHCGGQPFCRLFLAVAYLELDALSMAKLLAGEAIEGFRIRGMNWNQALSHWLLGVILLQEGNTESAQRALKKALEMLERLLRESRLESKNKQARECKEYINLIEKSLSKISRLARKRSPLSP
ncbi:MAG TPA: hypothetical protein VK897_24915 [Anaerolineales bacterium]|nr:hypothetical protein [Anaerolineales bacterium]